MRKVLFNNTTQVDDGAQGITQFEDVPAGQISIFDAYSNGSLDLGGANATDKMVIVQGREGEKRQIVTQIIEKDKIVAVTSKNYVAPKKQISNVGYNKEGNGAIPLDSTDGGEYIITLTDLDPDNRPETRHTSSFLATKDDTQYDIANGLAVGINTRRNKFVSADVLSDITTAQLKDTNGSPANVTLDVREGSKVVVATVTSAKTVDASAGDYIRIGHATDDDYPVYKIAEMRQASGTEQELVLDRAYVGATASTVAAGSTSTAMTGKAAGLKLVGKDEGISFNTAKNGLLVDADFLSVQAPDLGSGTYEQLRDFELECLGEGRGYYDRLTPFKATPEDLYAKDSLTYDLVTILHKNDNDDDVVRQNQYSEITLAYKQGELSSASTDFNTFFGV